MLSSAFDENKMFQKYMRVKFDKECESIIGIVSPSMVKEVEFSELTYMEFFRTHLQVTWCMNNNDRNQFNGVLWQLTGKQHASKIPLQHNCSRGELDSLLIWLFLAKYFDNCWDVFW